MIDHSQVRVLIVDDEPAVRDSIEGFLEDCEFNVTVSESAEDALDLIKEKKFDVAIVDMRLPGMNGDTLVLKAHALVPALKYLILTGSLDYDISKDLLGIGLKQDNILRKPLKGLTRLVDCIEKILQD